MTRVTGYEVCGRPLGSGRLGVCIGGFATRAEAAAFVWQSKQAPERDNTAWMIVPVQRSPRRWSPVRVLLLALFGMPDDDES